MESSIDICWNLVLSRAGMLPQFGILLHHTCSKDFGDIGRIYLDMVPVSISITEGLQLLSVIWVMSMQFVRSLF